MERIEQAAIDLTIPILLIRGQLSDVVSVEGVEDFLAKVPGAEFVELSDAGHTAAGDDNDAFSESVVDFSYALSHALTRQAGSLSLRRRRRDADGFAPDLVGRRRGDVVDPWLPVHRRRPRPRHRQVRNHFQMQRMAFRLCACLLSCRDDCEPCP